MQWLIVSWQNLIYLILKSDIHIGGKFPGDEDPHDTEEPTTAPQELEVYFDGDIQFAFVERTTTPERREANENYK